MKSSSRSNDHVSTKCARDPFYIGSRIFEDNIILRVFVISIAFTRSTVEIEDQTRTFTGIFTKHVVFI